MESVGVEEVGNSWGLRCLDNTKEAVVMLARNVGQSARTHGKLTPSICGGWSVSSGTSLFPMQKLDRAPVSHFSPQVSNPGVSLFWHIAPMDSNLDAKKILFAFPPEG